MIEFIEITDFGSTGVKHREMYCYHRDQLRVHLVQTVRALSGRDKKWLSTNGSWKT
jgi:hypothetical protein